MSIKLELKNNTSGVKAIPTNLNLIKVKTLSTDTVRTDAIKDNKPIPVHTNSRDNIQAKDSCNVEAKKLELLIKDETTERKLADDKLEKEIQAIEVGGVAVDEDTIKFNSKNELSINPKVLDGIDDKIDEVDDKIDEVDNKVKNKQDEIKFINVDSTSGLLDASSLNLLRGSNVHRLVYNNVIYYMSLRDGNVKKYFSRVASSTLNELDLNINTGEYKIKSTLDPIIEEHINNKVIHVTKEDRRRWDNKVTASVTQIEEDDYKLNLTKD